MFCEHDLIVLASTLTFAFGALVAFACTQYHDDTVNKTLRTQDNEIKTLSLKLDKVHAQYQEDMLTILRETLHPASQRSSVAGESSDERSPILDNNSIPAGPSDPQ